MSCVARVPAGSGGIELDCRGGLNDLALLEAMCRSSDRRTAAVVDAAGNVIATPAAKKPDGMGTEAWLRLCGRRTYGDRSLFLARTGLGVSSVRQV